MEGLKNKESEEEEEEDEEEDLEEKGRRSSLTFCFSLEKEQKH
jgi:hypothetical protein